jgi:antitoxin component YwqK of YwqJK toxin-antitoxin module
LKNCPGAVTFKGEWQYGEKHGLGKCFDGAGKLIYEGLFVNDKPAGNYPYRPIGR